jgi:hypothetical protein
MTKLIMILWLLTSLISCASASRDKQGKIENTEEMLDLAEANASPGGRKVLEASRAMISNQELHVGGCWNYINAVYDRAGYASSKQRETIYKSKFNGPYVKSDVIQTGDWLYFVNHSFSESEHSAIFVAWIDEEKKEALMVNYVGGNKKKPGTYKRFILDEVYNVFRAQD